MLFTRKEEDFLFPVENLFIQFLLSLFHGRAFAKLPLQSRTGWGGTHHVTQIQKNIIQIRPSLLTDFFKPGMKVFLNP